MPDVTNESAIERDRVRLTRCTPAVDPISSLALGRVLRDRYVLHERLGKDAEGAVFKALDRFRSRLPETQQYVALKILHAGGDCSEETLAQASQEFHCGQLLSHRNTVNVYELDRDADVVFFTMELLEGEPLSSLLKRLHPASMRKSQAWELIQQLGAGLAHAHEHGVVHGDLKPRNIFITREGELRILDFCAAHGPAAGAYASCEQLEGRPADPRDDLYSLACISYELLAGTHPFGSRPATLARDYRVSLARPPGLAGRQWRALQKGLSWHRAGRSISVRLWMHRLMKEKEHEHAVTPLQEITRSERVQSKIPWRAAAVFLIVTLTTFAVLAQRRSSARKSIDAPARVVSTPTHRDLVSTPPRDAGPATSVLVTQAAASSAIKAQARGADQASGGADQATGGSLGNGASGAILASSARAAKAAPSVMSVEPSQVTTDDHFAEIRLHRNLLKKSGSFTWWTEPATAKAGVDYMPEAVALQTFPAGYRTTRLYVRLLPQSLRAQRSYFYIAIAQSGPHQTPGKVIRRQIWLPSSSNLQAKR
jgi:hypothetical protein